MNRTLSLLSVSLLLAGAAVVTVWDGGDVATAAPAAGNIVIDDFATNQTALTLTFPPAGTSASSSASGAGVLGGERDTQVSLTGGVIAGNSMSAAASSGFFSYSQDATISGTSTLQWDGTDGSPTLNATGLGGLDLTDGLQQDALELDLTFDDLPINATITVYTDAGNASAYTLALPGLVFAASSFVIPYTAFSTLLGVGADFENVGAITLGTGSSVTAPDLVIDALHTTATVTAKMTAALVVDDGDLVAEPGETLRYSTTISNPSDALLLTSAALAFNSGVNGGTLVIGSVTTTVGTVTNGNDPGDTSIDVTIGQLANGASAQITFDVVITATGSTISNQGLVSAATLVIVTDDPGVAGASDATVTAIVQPPATTTSTTTTTIAPTTVPTTTTPATTAATATTTAAAPAIAVTTTPALPTTTLSRGLPATGSDTSSGLWLTLVLLLTGGALIAVARRRPGTAGR